MFRWLVPLLLMLSSPCQAICLATTYGSSCGSDSSCDAHQKCVSAVCRCNPNERRFWTGDTCAICATDYTFTNDRCYKYFNDLKTWTAARAHCRVQYADLFTWRNNQDEQFIRPIVSNWASSGAFIALWELMFSVTKQKVHLAWSGATITSFNPLTVKWVDPDGLKLELTSKQWCDPTKDAGYTLAKQPTRATRDGKRLVAGSGHALILQGPNGTENEECVTYNFASSKIDLLCLADDYCRQTYPFICEMNAASMKLALATHHGNNGDASSTGGGIDFEKPPPPPPTTETENEGAAPSALSDKSSALFSTNMIIFIAVGVVLLVGAAAGFVVIQKKKLRARNAGGQGDASAGRPSVASSMGSMMDE